MLYSEVLREVLSGVRDSPSSQHSCLGVQQPLQDMFRRSFELVLACLVLGVMGGIDLGCLVGPVGPFITKLG